VHSIYNQVLVHFVRQPKNVIYFPIIYFILIKYAVLTYTFKSYTLAYLYLHISFGRGAGENRFLSWKENIEGFPPLFLYVSLFGDRSENRKSNET